MKFPMTINKAQAPLYGLVAHSIKMVQHCYK